MFILINLNITKTRSFFMVKNQLKGAAGVQINIQDISGRPNTTAVPYRIGLVGWTPKGPSNTPVVITNENDLYSIFGTPAGYKPYQVYLLHNAKILLNAGAQVVIVRTVDGTIGSTTATEVLNFGVYHIPTSGAPTISQVDASLALNAISNNIDVAIATKKKQVLAASADTNSPFSIFLQYPGFDGYYVKIQTFESSIAGASDYPVGDVAHSLNVAPGLSYYNSERAAFKSYVQGLGLYTDYYTVSTRTPVVAQYLTANVSGAYYLQGDGSYAKTGSGTKFLLSSTPGVGSVTVYAMDALNASLVTTQTYLDSTGAYFSTDLVLMYGDVYSVTNNAFYTAIGGNTTEFSTIPAGGNADFILNTALNSFLDIFLIVRVYNSKTASTPLETLYATTAEYVTDSGDQLEISYATSSILNFRVNDTSSVTSVKNKGVGISLLTGGTTLPFYRKSAALALAWSLFTDITNVEVSLLIDGGSSIVNFGNDRENDGLESADLNVVNAILTASSVRMDAPCVIDLPKRSSINDLITLFKKYPSIGNEVDGSTASYASFWGNAQDGRQIINDTFNKKQIEAARSVFKGIVAFNVYTTSYPWQTQWGPNRGLITTPSVGTINPRTYPDEVGLLSTNRINPSRLNSTGEYFWDDYTLMAKSSVLQRWHAVCFLANLNKRYRKLLEQYVAELNTSALRKTIWNALNDDLNFIMNHADPQGLYNYSVICDETNNTPEVIDAGQLNVDVGLEIVRDTRVISLTTTLYRTGGIVQSGIKL